MALVIEVYGDGYISCSCAGERPQNPTEARALTRKFKLSWSGAAGLGIILAGLILLAAPESS
jgi:hypothetical protein